MRIAIYDPDEGMRKQLYAMLKMQLYSFGISVFAEMFDDSAVLCGEVLCGGYDVLFLETDDNGLAAARHLRQQCFGGEIVFCSSGAEFAVHGYDVGACGYLLKPYDPSRLINLVARLSKMHHADCLTIRHRRAIVRVPYHEIVFIESRNTKCLIHRTDGEPYTVYRRLDELESQLHDRRFIRSHQSYLVNMDWVVKADKCFEMTNGALVAIRQRDHRRICERYMTYLRSKEAQRDSLLSTK